VRGLEAAKPGKKSKVESEKSKVKSEKWK
jgi:hypothetical protein